ncbi:hypothetical protein LCGC14_1889250, partial [marine sediment metagenome]
MSPQASTIPDRKPALDEWEYHLSEIITGGEDYSTRSELIQEGGSVSVENMFFHKGRAVKDFGFATFGGVVRGVPRLDYQFNKSDGSSELVLLTNATLYTWNVTAAEWQYVSDGNDTTMRVAGVATDLVIDVVSIAGFSNGDFIGVLLDDGTQHQTTINGVPAGTLITITDALPSGAAIGKVVVKAVDFAGSSVIPISIATWTAKDRIYIANGVDTPRWYDGATCEIIENLPATTFSCRLIRVFNDYILLFHTVEDGTAYPQRERWSDAGFDNIWNETVNFNDFYQNDDWITAA